MTHLCQCHIPPPPFVEHMVRGERVWCLPIELPAAWMTGAWHPSVVEQFAAVESLDDVARNLVGFPPVYPRNPEGPP